MSRVIVQKPCAFSLKEKETMEDFGTKSCSEACAETKVINSENMDDSNDSDVLSAGCALASPSGVESLEKLSEQEIISPEQSQTVYEDHSNVSEVNTQKSVKSQVIRTN